MEKVTSEPLKPVTEHKKELEEEGISTSERIMRSRLNEAGYYCYKARKKPWISDKNKEHRLKWATERLNWPLSKWYRVMWTDESKFQLFKPDGNARVWRKEGTAWDVKWWWASSCLGCYWERWSWKSLPNQGHEERVPPQDPSSTGQAFIRSKMF